LVEKSDIDLLSLNAPPYWSPSSSIFAIPTVIAYFNNSNFGLSSFFITYTFCSVWLISIGAIF
jgi:hypothetical protein